MKTVTTIHLNGRAYQVEDEAHKALAAYLEKAGEALADNPDKDEILADFEQAIAEKFSKYLTPNKNVITHKEIETIIAEMGPVRGTDAANENDAKKAESEEGRGEKRSGENGSAKRLYRIKEGAVIAGVCNGLAAYFDIDVTIVRIAFVVLTIISHGAGLLAYFIMMMIIPKAGTQEERAQAKGAPFTAHEFIEQAKKNYAEFKDDKQGWKKQWREQKHYWKYKAKEAQYEMHDWGRRHQRRTAVHDTGNLIVKFIVSLVCAALSLAFAAAIVMLVMTGTFFTFVLPVGLPLWVAIVGLICIYNMVVWPFRFALFPHGSQTGDNGFFDTLDAIMWMGLFAILAWVLYRKVPEAHRLMDMLGHWVNVHIFKRT